MKVKATICPKCGDQIFSRARHDMRYCNCRSISIDGGFDYSRGSFAEGIKANEIKSVEIEVPATQDELYWDWWHGKDKFGWIEKDDWGRGEYKETKMKENEITIVVNTEEAIKSLDELREKLESIQSLVENIFNIKKT
ncbi:unnamed protein product [marine sediment metagenome]|uniref:DUF7695 domain-containing protein n=1 Tax=marine sediment metagenome TaxID=412755 RepID=X0RUU6_9ZZZZ